ncbi:PEP-CTERM sorting domain-containing protein [Pontiella sulfatireligans]|uniref:PEP-CTERM protein-sorting domain-containing protein n=1 Tax=Pontiella sulfatireligans TaxID=2750658 RepID=A0A6C2UWR3_9BACT|nr:PEP-CTERM sorting domain-containing protein [Pontiella sulfatireligans]VGO23557.1 hypothetical protein SCARR_05664 [Pontiella sulfatireligans]
MNKIRCIIMIGLLTGVLASVADVSVSFPVTDTVLRNLNVLTLEFTVDGSGDVTLDAQSSNGGALPQAVVNAWDGAAGTVSAVSLFNTSFTLTGVAKLNGSQVINLSTDANTPGPGLGVMNPILNGAGTEEIVWTYSGTGGLNFKGVDYGNRVANGDSNLTFLDSDTRTEYLLPNTSTSGSIDLVGEGFSLANGDSFIMTTDDLRNNLSARAASAGASVTGMTFEVIPEPATLGLISAFGGGILFIRRRFMM